MTVKRRLVPVRRRGTMGAGLGRPSARAVGLGRSLLLQFVGRVVWVGPRSVLDELLSRGSETAKGWRVVVLVARVMVMVMVVVISGHMLLPAASSLRESACVREAKHAVKAGIYTPRWHPGRPRPHPPTLP